MNDHFVDCDERRDGDEGVMRDYISPSPVVRSLNRGGRSKGLCFESTQYHSLLCDWSALCRKG